MSIFDNKERMARTDREQWREKHIYPFIKLIWGIFLFISVCYTIGHLILPAFGIYWPVPEEYTQ